MLYYNPNTWPAEEYYRRGEELKKFVAQAHPLGVTVIEDRYDPQEFYTAVQGLENEPERGRAVHRLLPVCGCAGRHSTQRSTALIGSPPRSPSAPTRMLPASIKSGRSLKPNSASGKKPLEKDDLITLIDRTLKDQEKGLGKEKIIIDENAKSFLADQAGGDARSVLNALELAYLTTERNKKGIISITLEVAEQCIRKKAIRYDKNGDNHYDTISAFIESMKHTDPDATLYYLARMLIAGEDVKYIARRICVCASEDIGLANSQALVVATNAFLAVERIGMPESTTILAHAALYVCCSPKSSAVSNGIYQAMDEVKQNNGCSYSSIFTRCKL